jgi:hypothetical protein
VIAKPIAASSNTDPSERPSSDEVIKRLFLIARSRGIA